MLLLTVLESTASLNVAVIAAVVLTAATPFAGENEVTAGPWVGAVVVNTTSTQ